MKKEKNFERILIKTLELLDEGKTFSQILNDFPKYRKELEEIYKIVELISSQKITPDKKTLENIITTINDKDIVTKEQSVRYLNRRENFKKGRLSSTNNINNLFFMKRNWKIIASIGALTLIAAVIVFVQITKKSDNVNIVSVPEKESIANNETQSTAGKTQSEKEKFAVATGNIDDAASAIINDAVSEISQLEKDINEDTALLSLESEELNGLLQDQYSNENDF